MSESDSTKPRRKRRKNEPPRILAHHGSGHWRVWANGRYCYLGMMTGEPDMERYEKFIADPTSTPSKTKCRELARQARNRERKERNAWSSMKRRCLDPTASGYNAYGARGVWVCQRWQESFSAFLDDLGRAPSAGHSLDRIDNEKGYCCGKCDDCRQRGVPMNCRWATWDVQCRNKRNARVLTFKGKCKPLVEWAEITGLEPQTIAHRLHRGWSVTKALTAPTKACSRPKEVLSAAPSPANYAFGLMSEFWR